MNDLSINCLFFTVFKKIIIIITKVFEIYFENPKSEKNKPGEWCGEHVCEVSSKSEHGKGV